MQRVLVLLFALSVSCGAPSVPPDSGTPGDGAGTDAGTPDAGQGHQIPPFPAPTDGGTRFAGFWDFFDAHPYGLPPGVTPWQTTGLPATLPAYCGLAP
ncbi:MAG: hypothetical protein AB1730_17900 [Myxococcota bacterium]|jgi:hypothetical protein